MILGADAIAGRHRLKVLAITRKPHSASFEQRIHNYIEPLKAYGVDVTVRIYPRELAGQSAVLAEAGEYDVVWWHRHLLPWWRLRVLRRNAKYLVYDFDDPVCFSTRGSGRSFVRRRRFAALLKAVDAAMVGSHYLHDLAVPYCKSVTIVPMAISLPQPAVDMRPVKDKIELLWLGSESTQKYLETIRPALEALGEQRPDMRLRLVAHRPMSFGRLSVDFVQWTPETQECALRECDIGLCPMPDTPWTRGKCPYKVLQYMAYGMPWVGSAVGENLVAAGEPRSSTQSGLCASDTAEWVKAILTVACNSSQRRLLGSNGCNYIVQNHERKKVAERVASVLSSSA